jgi:hypothetical protein
MTQSTHLGLLGAFLRLYSQQSAQQIVADLDLGENLGQVTPQAQNCNRQQTD